MKNASTIFAVAAILGACTSTADSRDSTTGRTLEKTGEGLGDAVLSPLEDLNLRREPVPTLVKDETSPYAIDGVASFDCPTLAIRITELDGILGNDFDVPVPDEDEMTDAEKEERRAEQASDATLGFVSSEARGFIPFRGVVRYASGASSHEKALARAFAIASQRRAFLKGIGLAKGCPPPASPLPVEPIEDKIVYRQDHPKD